MIVLCICWNDAAGAARKLLSSTPTLERLLVQNFRIMGVMSFRDMLARDGFHSPRLWILAIVTITTRMRCEVLLYGWMDTRRSRYRGHSMSRITLTGTVVGPRCVVIRT